MAQDTNLVGQLTPEQIAELKKAHPRGLFAVEVDGHVAYFASPDRKAMNAAMSATSAESPLDYFESLMADTFVAGSEEIKTDDSLFMAAVGVFKDIVETKQAKLVKL